MSWAVAAVAGGTLLSAGVGMAASSKAARAQRDSAQQASDTELQMFNQTRADQAPYREEGYKALAQIGSGTQQGGEFNRDFTLADFVKDPGYDFRQQQGQQSLEHSAAARGGLLNGGTLKALTRYGQDYASGEYSNAYNRFNADRTTRFNRLATVAGVGQTSVGQTGALGAQTAANVGNNITGAGNAQAAGYIGQGNAVTGAVNSLGNFYLQNQFLKQAPTAKVG